MYFTLVGSWAFFRTRLERSAKDKRCSLLQKIVNYGHKKFIIIGPRVDFMVLKHRQLRIDRLLIGRAYLPCFSLVVMSPATT